MQPTCWLRRLEEERVAKTSAQDVSQGSLPIWSGQGRDDEDEEKIAGMQVLFTLAALLLLFAVL